MSEFSAVTNNQIFWFETSEEAHNFAQNRTSGYISLYMRTGEEIRYLGSVTKREA